MAFYNKRLVKSAEGREPVLASGIVIKNQEEVSIMKQKKMLALSLVLVLLASLFVMVPVSAVTQQVSLIYAKPYIENVAVGVEGYVEVENISPDKVVTIHYSKNGATWFDAQAEYFKPTRDNYEAWKFKAPALSIGPREYATIEFAIKYEVNGQTYWDNNNGANYKVKAGYGASTQYDFGNGGITYWYDTPQETGVSIYTQLKNLSYDKDVRVRYSTDNWETYEEASGSYVASFPGSDIEQWKIDVPTTEAFEYAISYTAAGTTYWDNNFGENYKYEPAA